MFDNMLEKAFEKNQEVIILGDVNISFNCRKRNDFKDSLSLYGLKQIIKPTRVTKETSTLIN
jgi:hypothetical protein